MAYGGPIPEGVVRGQFTCYVRRNDLDRKTFTGTAWGDDVSRRPVSFFSRLLKPSYKGLLFDDATRVLFEIDSYPGDYCRFAALNPGPLPIDPVGHLGALVRASGMEFRHLFWDGAGRRGARTNDFTQSIARIRSFLLDLPKPCGVYIGSIRFVHLVYRACVDTSIDVPRDVALIANTDDPEFGINLRPSVSVLTGEFPDTGRRLAVR